MFVLNDDRCNTYIRENGKIVARRAGEPEVFHSKEEADAALAEYFTNNPWLRHPVWVEAL